MDAAEVVRTLQEEYGIYSLEELDRKIRELKPIDISIFTKED